MAVNARHRTTTPGENGIGGAQPHLVFAPSSPLLYGNAVMAEDPEFKRNRSELLVELLTPAQVQFLVSLLNVLKILSVKQTYLKIYFATIGTPGISFYKNKKVVCGTLSFWVVPGTWCRTKVHTGS